MSDSYSSMQYSYSFSEALQQAWHWTERYQRQAEILRYLNHVAERFDLLKDIQFNTRVRAATYDESDATWMVDTDRGDRVQARFLISAAGFLSAGRLPDIRGLGSFKGPWHHTGNWPHEEVSFSGQRVGVIGTGSSGIQAIPAIAREARQLVVFLRTPNFSIPAWNGLPADEDQREWKTPYAERRQEARGTRSGILYQYSPYATHQVTPAERQQEYERRWARGGRRMGRACERGRVQDPVPNYQLLVRGSQHSRQAARVFTLHWRLSGLNRDLQRGGGRWLPGVQLEGQRAGAGPTLKDTTWTASQAMCFCYQAARAAWAQPKHACWWSVAER